MFIIKKINNMISETINYLLGIASKHKLINSIGYKETYNFNDNHNDKQFQFIIDSTNLIEKNMTENVIKYKLEIYCLGFVKTNMTILDIQDQATHMLIDFINYIDNDNTYPIEVNDWSILSFSEYTDNKSSGARLTLDIIIPNILNLCEYRDNFIEKEEEIKVEMDINPVDCNTNNNYNTNTSTLIINPIKLKN